MTVLSSYTDGWTLLALNALLHLVAAVMLFCVRRAVSNRRGLGGWIVSNLLCSLGFVLIGSHVESLVLRSLVANLLIDAGAVFAYVAVVRFLDRPRRELWPVVPAALLGVAQIVHFDQVGLDLYATTLLGCSARAFVMLALVWQLLHADPLLRPATTVSAIIHLLWVAMLLGRIAWWVGTDFQDTLVDPTTPYALLIRIVVTFMVAPCYCWMLLRRLDHELWRQAREDALTGLANRRTMWADGDKATLHGRRSGDPVALLMIDIDHFKRINDRFGHRAGDATLVAVAQCLAAALRQGDRVARVGGEEFIVLMPGTRRALAAAIAEQLRVAVAAVAVPDPAVPGCTISIGYAVQGDDGDNWEALVAAADRGLYRAKLGGRNRVEAAPRDDGRYPAGPLALGGVLGA